MRVMIEKYGWYLFRFGIASIFLYFGVLAVLNPQLQSQIWIDKNIGALVGVFIPLSTFMVIFGVFQILVALSIITGYLYKLGLTLAFFMLFAIIINLANSSGFNDVVLRDIVILTGVTYLLLL